MTAPTTGKVGADVSHEVQQTAGVTAEDGHAIAELISFRSPQERPDDVLAGADLLVLGVVQRILVGGQLRVPEDLAVVGYDNNREAWSSMVSITTLDQAGEEMGRAAAAMLLEQIRAPAGHVNRRIVLDPVLVPKRSTLRAEAQIFLGA